MNVKSCLKVGNALEKSKSIARGGEGYILG
jgi:hypothetical protein